MTGNNIGDFMKNAQIGLAKGVTTLVTMFALVAGVVYAEVHGWNMLAKGVNPDILVFAAAGMVLVGVTALVLPYSMLYAWHSPKQQLWGIFFEAVDLGILFMNAVIDFNMTAGGQLPDWAGGYVAWVVPATPLIVFTGWLISMHLSPEAEEISAIERLKSATRLTLNHRIAKKAERADIDAQLDSTANAMAEDLIFGALNTAQRHAAPRNVIPAQARDPRRAPLAQQQPPAKRVPGEPVPANPCPQGSGGLPGHNSTNTITG